MDDTLALKVSSCLPLARHKRHQFGRLFKNQTLIWLLWRTVLAGIHMALGNLVSFRRRTAVHWLWPDWMVHVPIANVMRGMGAPGRIRLFPSLETMHTGWVHHHPDVAGSQIIILAPDHADVFTSVPHIVVWSGCHRHRRRRNHYLGRSHHNRLSPCLAGIGEGQRRCRHTGTKYRFKIPFHFDSFCCPLRVCGREYLLYALAVPQLL
jgi:hypothetical protein